MLQWSSTSVHSVVHMHEQCPGVQPCPLLVQSQHLALSQGYANGGTAMPRSLTLDDVFAIERVTDAQINPDGTCVAFTVAREYTEGEHDLPASAVWIVPCDGAAPPRRFTASPHSDS